MPRAILLTRRRGHCGGAVGVDRTETRNGHAVCPDWTIETGAAAVEPRRGRKQLARCVLARARAQERAGWPALHRRGAARYVSLARLSHRHRLAHGHRLRAAAVVLAPARPRGHRSRAGSARSPRRATAVVRRRLGIWSG